MTAGSASRFRKRCISNSVLPDPAGACTMRECSRDTSRSRTAASPARAIVALVGAADGGRLLLIIRLPWLLISASTLLLGKASAQCRQMATAAGSFIKGIGVGHAGGIRLSERIQHRLPAADVGFKVIAGGKVPAGVVPLLRQDLRTLGVTGELAFAWPQHREGDAGNRALLARHV